MVILSLYSVHKTDTDDGRVILDLSFDQTDENNDTSLIFKYFYPGNPIKVSVLSVDDKVEFITLKDPACYCFTPRLSSNSLFFSNLFFTKKSLKIQTG